MRILLIVLLLAGCATPMERLKSAAKEVGDDYCRHSPGHRDILNLGASEFNSYIEDKTKPQKNRV